jgi:amino acid transporter
MASSNYYRQAPDAPDKSISVLASPDPFIENTLNDDGHEGDFVTPNEQKDLRRGLYQRHIGLIALAGAIVCFQSPQPH